MHTHKYLSQNVWTRPQYYAGFNPEGDCCVMTRNRDSDILTESNWDCAGKLLGAEEFDGGPWYDSDGTAFARRPVCYTWRASHCLVGWVEYMMLRADAPRDMLARAEELLEGLDAYPVVDEDDWSERECNAVFECWEQMSVRERAQVIAESDCGASIFAARRADMPEKDDGSLFEYLRERVA